ncbi:uncharacterized protein LOC133904059 [Phragmites australis]|uniref:uncharacterized protein LOC133904059 n=1 Tax=Phragmites australis TaxID=29695 RepID=UPI002D77468C|nr:uncharacterized protein LOC133904059 [Phragmites australis]
MEMVPCCYDGDADWYQALDDFPPLCSSSSSPLALRSVSLQRLCVPTDRYEELTTMQFVILSVEDCLPIPADAPPGQLMGCKNDFGASHGALAADCSSSALINLRSEDSYYVPVFSGPPAAAGDQYYGHQLPPIPPAFGDIDLEAFGDADEHKGILDDMMMIVPADPHPARTQPSTHSSTVGQNAGEDARDHHKSMAMVDCYRPGASAFETAVMHHGEQHGARYFYMPITKAAREMNVGLTVLKKRCRELGVARWPHRKMKSLKSLILNVQEIGNGMSPAAVQQELLALETCCALMEENPSIELTDRTKKLRQACFKESYKRRRAAAAVNVIDHIYSFDQHHPLPQVQAPSSQSSNSFYGY